MNFSPLVNRRTLISLFAAPRAEFPNMSTSPAISLHLSGRNGSVITTASEQPPVSVQRPICSGPNTPTGESLVSDLSMTELNAIHDHLWIVGSYGNISPLHYQRVLLRDIIPCEMSRLHLVWFDRTIYIKPLPDCLLSDTRYLNEGFDDFGEVVGFLRSYCSLIRYPVDLVIAKESNLISEGVNWKQWATFRDITLNKTEDFHINKRYEYGELRLNRLDIIYRLTGRGLTYFTVHRTYKTYFTQYFSLFVTFFAFLALVLTAMRGSRYYPGYLRDGGNYLISIWRSGAGQRMSVLWLYPFNLCIHACV